MKKLIIFGLLLTLLGATSCSLDDTDEECAIGPVLILLDLVEEGSNANLYSNGTFQQSQLAVVDNNGQRVDHNFLTVDGRTFIRMRLGEATGNKTVTLTLNSDTTLDIEYTMAVTAGACANNYISDFDIPGYDFDQSSASGAIRVYFPDSEIN